MRHLLGIIFNREKKDSFGVDSTLTCEFKKHTSTFISKKEEILEIVFE